MFSKAFKNTELTHTGEPLRERDLERNLKRGSLGNPGEHVGQGWGTMGQPTQSAILNAEYEPLKGPLCLGAVRKPKAEGLFNQQPFTNQNISSIPEIPKHIHRSQLSIHDWRCLRMVVFWRDSLTLPHEARLQAQGTPPNESSLSLFWGNRVCVDVSAGSWRLLAIPGSFVTACSWTAFVDVWRAYCQGFVPVVWRVWRHVNNTYINLYSLI